MVGESDKNVCLIQIDASSFAEFDISELEISRVDCSYLVFSKTFEVHTHIPALPVYRDIPTLFEKELPM